MKTPHRFLLVTSFALLSFLNIEAQKEDRGIEVQKPLEEVAADTVAPKPKINKYGLRVGIDLSKPLRSFLDDTYQGFAIVGDFRIKDRYYLAAEIGTESKEFDDANYFAKTQGSYIKAGFNYNAYNNWVGMSNMIYVGLHAGFSTFNQDLDSYTIYTTNSFFDPNLRTVSRNYSNLNLTWLELQMGLQVELFNNLYMGLNVQLKRMITQKEPDGFTNLYAPGYNKVTFDNVYGAGYGYTISYLIPLFKK
ncbi:hypothetical protein DSM03_103492 [Leeuwenhoekiella aestuarii]|uniref:Outer membrane protein with beta-barrel domain n=1 Tax=Leeuwenhoekiella aestuarii TaxID=2249426 RepID=A0A4Q0NYG2_9FLAO|nr:DUF6048 family protein [Leeuwenhoekiella aestuarii]RXG16305.1 hypothetical protein DSM03_103492 [Leeuwenhoekiella aestuarii]RXG16998.1 hypothetical protein DSM04_102581 [Leeuwenhoekiella aestuarii]